MGRGADVCGLTNVHTSIIKIIMLYTLSSQLTHTFVQIGMVAWRLTMLTPEYPDGREVIIIANDLTYQIGSFGPLEDQLFKVHVLYE